MSRSVLRTCYRNSVATQVKNVHANILGGCCGTNVRHVRQIALNVCDKKFDEEEGVKIVVQHISGFKLNWQTQNIKDETIEKKTLFDFIQPEELWACTTCNACAIECPVNIEPLSIILEMRRYLALEDAAAPAPINTVFSNIENNGAPWQYSPEDRMLWAEKLTISES